MILIVFLESSGAMSVEIPGLVQQLGKINGNNVEDANQNVFHLANMYF